jgi:hypothetical protein
MSDDAALSCRCGALRGCVKNAAPGTVNRVVCYCDDCQALAHHLGRADLLDPRGGTDIVQVAPTSLVFHQGTERIVGVRLTPTGLHRWYASCCKTPVGNTVGPAIPFIGIAAHSFAGDADRLFGEPIGAIYGKYAICRAPEDSTGWNLGLYARAIWMVLGWRLSGQTWPHPFFDRTTGAQSRPLTILSPAEREALRPLCGPRPIGADVA